jgi:DNA-binding phage protein
VPNVVEDYSDVRNKAWCIHCCANLAEAKVTRDHTPSKVLLDQPYPNNLAVTPVCGACNQGFSLDEEYFSAFLSAVLSGTTDPDKQIIEHAKKALARNRTLTTLIERQKVEQLNLFNSTEIEWYPDVNRVKNVILKNARAHLFYENGEPMLDEPEAVSFFPLALMSDRQFSEFFIQDQFQPWCEVGSRWNTRLIQGDEFDEFGFLVVQPGVYRFRIEGGGAGVRSVIREYLTTTVYW